MYRDVPKRKWSSLSEEEFQEILCSIVNKAMESEEETELFCAFLEDTNVDPELEWTKKQKAKAVLWMVQDMCGIAGVDDSDSTKDFLKGQGIDATISGLRNGKAAWRRVWISRFADIDSKATKQGLAEHIYNLGDPILPSPFDSDTSGLMEKGKEDYGEIFDEDVIQMMRRQALVDHLSSVTSRDMMEDIKASIRKYGLENEAGAMLQDAKEGRGKFIPDATKGWPDIDELWKSTESIESEPASLNRGEMAKGKRK